MIDSWIVCLMFNDFYGKCKGQYHRWYGMGILMYYDWFKYMYFAMILLNLDFDESWQSFEDSPHPCLWNQFYPRCSIIIYLHFSEQWPHSEGNVGKNSAHGASGYVFLGYFRHFCDVILHPHVRQDTIASLPCGRNGTFVFNGCVEPLTIWIYKVGPQW